MSLSLLKIKQGLICKYIHCAFLDQFVASAASRGYSRREVYYGLYYEPWWKRIYFFSTCFFFVSYIFREDVSKMTQLSRTLLCFKDKYVRRRKYTKTYDLLDLFLRSSWRKTFHRSRLPGTKAVKIKNHTSDVQSRCYRTPQEFMESYARFQGTTSRSLEI